MELCFWITGQFIPTCPLSCYFLLFAACGLPEQNKFALIQRRDLDFHWSSSYIFSLLHCIKCYKRSLHAQKQIQKLYRKEKVEMRFLQSKHYLLFLKFKSFFHISNMSCSWGYNFHHSLPQAGWPFMITHLIASWNQFQKYAKTCYTIETNALKLIQHSLNV